MRRVGLFAARITAIARAKDLVIHVKLDFRRPNSSFHQRASQDGFTGLSLGRPTGGWSIIDRTAPPTGRASPYGFIGLSLGRLGYRRWYLHTT
jgi:hypothetical protein